MLLTRSNANLLYGFATVNGLTGLVLLPDDSQVPDKFQSGIGPYSQNSYSESKWAKLEAVGAVFLPAAGDRVGSDVYDDNGGCYWSSTPVNDDYARCFFFRGDYLNPQYKDYRNHGLSVRLVQDVK